MVYCPWRRYADRFRVFPRPVAIERHWEVTPSPSPFWPDEMSVTGFTPPAPETPSTSSGSNNPAVPALKAPRLVAGSCASKELERTSTAELVHRLVSGSPPSAEAAAEASWVDSSHGSSPVKSEESLEGLQVPARGGGNLRGCTPTGESAEPADCRGAPHGQHTGTSFSGFSW